MKFRKKPVEVEAMRWNGINLPEIKAWMGVESLPWNAQKNTFLITTLEGNMEAQLDDWIIKGVAGEFYPCKPDIFEATYEKVS